MGSVRVVNVEGDHLRPGVRPDGDDRGFREFVAARRPALLRTAGMMTGNPADAELVTPGAAASGPGDVSRRPWHYPPREHSG